MKKVIIALSLFPTIVCSFDKINLHNQTDKTIYAAVYWVPQFGGKVIRKSPVASIAAGKTEDLIRPHFKVAFDRDLAFSFNEKDLRKEFTSTDKFREYVSTKNVGMKKGSNYWLHEQDDVVKA